MNNPSRKSLHSAISNPEGPNRICQLHWSNGDLQNLGFKDNWFSLCFLHEGKRTRTTRTQKKKKTEHGCLFKQVVGIFWEKQSHFRTFLLKGMEGTGKYIPIFCRFSLKFIGKKDTWILRTTMEKGSGCVEYNRNENRNGNVEKNTSFLFHGRQYWNPIQSLYIFSMSTISTPFPF